MTSASLAAPSGNLQAHAMTPADRPVIDGETVVLTDITAPAFAPYEAAYAIEAARETEALLLENTHQVNAEQRDRWGRRAGRVVFTDNQITLQEALIEAGAARVWPQTVDHDFIRHLLTKETTARGASKGLWSSEDYAILGAGTPETAKSGYHVFEGRVVKTGRGSGRVFINFGPDYKTDFTVTLTTGNARRWKKFIDIDSLEGQYVRVRGFVVWINGPSIELQHPLQLEFIDEPIKETSASEALAANAD